MAFLPIDALFRSGYREWPLACSDTGLMHDCESPGVGTHESQRLAVPQAESSAGRFRLARNHGVVLHFHIVRFRGYLCGITASSRTQRMELVSHLLSPGAGVYGQLSHTPVGSEYWSN